VISPLGYGLDENAIAAIQKWEFAPGKKDGTAVSIRATVEVSFRFLGTAFDEAYERRRTEFNVALQTLRRVEPTAKERAVASMVKLSQQNFPGALYVVGLWEVTGEVAPAVAQKPEAGWMKIEQASKKNFGPAIYRLAKRSLDDSGSTEKTWDNMRRAALLGSHDAQFFLGDRHQRGDGLELNLDRAKHYFRLCAAGGVPQCQDRLGHLMFDAPNRPDYEYEQALAWFSLAADRGIAPAHEIVERENTNLTSAQVRTIATLKRQFEGTSDQPQ
jgi:TPR repeat protein